MMMTLRTTNSCIFLCFALGKLFAIKALTCLAAPFCALALYLLWRKKPNIWHTLFTLLMVACGVAHIYLEFV